MKFASPSRRVALLAALASSLWLAACGGGGSGGGQTTVRAINLASDLPSVDIFTNDAKQFSALAVDTLAPSVGISANTYTINVKRAGDGATLLTGSYSLAENKHYTAVVWGRETALRLSTLPEDENDADIISASNTRIRVFNATTDTGAVDIFLTSSTADLGETTPTQAALGSGTLGGFRELSAGTYRLRVTGVGDPNDVRLDIPVVTLNAKKFATLVITAGSGGVLVNGTLIEQQAAATLFKNTQARVRAVASMNNAGNVAVSVGQSTVVATLRSPNIGPYVLVNSGTLDMTVRVNGAVIASGNRSFAAGGDYTVLAYGAEGAGQVQVLTDDNRLPSTTSRVKIRLLNGIGGGDPLTLSVDFLALLSNVPAGTASSYASANSNATTRIDVTSAAAISALFTQESVNLQGQGVYTVFLLGGSAAPQGVIRKER